MDTAIHKGKPFWSGVFDANDGFIREVHPYKRAKAADFHHSYYVSSQSQDAMKQGDAGFFWVDPDGSVNTDWREGSAPKHIVDAIQDQIEPILHKDNGGGITAYQGGPHSVGEEGFLDEKIGTGEGAQAYGHGHYFAEAEPVAQGYRDALAQKRNPTTSINDLIGQMSKNSPESRTPKNIQWYMKQDPMLSPHADDKEIVGHISEALNGQNADGSVSESALDAYGKLTDKFGRNPKGHMHEVSINAHPDHFLDWDKTIDEQSDYVKNALNKTEWWPWTEERIEDRAGRHGSNPQGRHLYEDLVEDYSPEEASKFLQDTDIHGIKYLDASSRSKGEGTRNYVVFDPKRVDIKRRYKDGGEVLPHDDPQREKNLAAFQEGNHPMVPANMYHGAGEHFTVFDRYRLGENTGAKDAKIGFHFSDNPSDADFYADKAAERLGNDSGVVGKYHLSIKNPLIIGGGHDNSNGQTEKFLLSKIAANQYAEKHGHDAIIYPHGNDYDSGYTAIVFNPNQIKSATGNNGDFNPSKPNINEARGGRIGYDYGGDVARGVDNPGGAADANRPAGTSSYAEHNLNAGSGTQTNGPSGGKLPDNRPDNSNDRFNIGGGNAPMPPQRGDDSFFGNMGGNIGSVLGGLAFGPLGSIGGRYLGNQFNQPDNSRFEAKNDEFGNPVGGGWLDFLGSGNPPAPMTSDNRRDPIIKPIKRKRRILMPDGTYQEVEEGMKSGGVAKSYNRVHNSKIVEHALSKVGVSLHTRRPPS